MTNWWFLPSRLVTGVKFTSEWSEWIPVCHGIPLSAFLFENFEYEFNDAGELPPLTQMLRTVDGVVNDRNTGSSGKFPVQDGAAFFLEGFDAASAQACPRETGFPPVSS